MAIKEAQEQDLASILDQQPLRGCCCLMHFLLPLQETPDQRVAAVVDEVEEAQQQALSPELIRTPELPEGVPTLNVALIFGGAITTAGLSALSQTRMWLQSMEGLSRQLVGHEKGPAVCFPVSPNTGFSVMHCQDTVYLAVQRLQARFAPAWLSFSCTKAFGSRWAYCLAACCDPPREYWCMLAVQPSQATQATGSCISCRAPQTCHQSRLQACSMAPDQKRLCVCVTLCVCVCVTQNSLSSLPTSAGCGPAPLC